MASLANKVAALTLTTLLSTGALADDKGTPIEAGGDVNLITDPTIIKVNPKIDVHNQAASTSGVEFENAGNNTNTQHLTGGDVTVNPEIANDVANQNKFDGSVNNDLHITGPQTTISPELETNIDGSNENNFSGSNTGTNNGEFDNTDQFNGSVNGSNTSNNTVDAGFENANENNFNGQTSSDANAVNGDVNADFNVNPNANASIENVGGGDGGSVEQEIVTHGGAGGVGHGGTGEAEANAELNNSGNATLTGSGNSENENQNHNANANDNANNNDNANHNNVDSRNSNENETSSNAELNNSGNSESNSASASNSAVDNSGSGNSSSNSEGGKVNYTNNSNYSSRALALQATQGGNSAIRQQFSSCNAVKNTSFAANALSNFMDALGIGFSNGKADIADERCQVIESYLARLENDQQFKFRMAYMEKEFDLKTQYMILEKVLERALNRRITPEQILKNVDGSERVIKGTNVNSDATPYEHATAWLLGAYSIHELEVALKTAATARSMIVADGKTKRPETTEIMVASMAAPVDYAAMKGMSHLEKIKMMQAFAKNAQVANDGSADTLYDIMADLNKVRTGFEDFVAENPAAGSSLEFGFNGEFPALKIQGDNGEYRIFNIGDREGDEKRNKDAYDKPQRNVGPK
jgi:hypothetical protein